MLLFLRLFCLLASLLATAMFCAAHGTEPIIITSRGRAVMTRPLTHVRVSVEVIGVGDNAASAAASLDENVKESLGRLASLGADQATIKRGGVAIAIPPPSPTPLGMTAFNAGEPTLADLPSGGAVSASPVLPPIPEPVPAAAEPTEKRLQQTVTFDIAVRGGTTAATMAEIADIEDRLRDADLSCVKRIEARRAKEDQREDIPKRPCLCGIGVPRFERICRLTRTEETSLAMAAVEDASRRAEIMAEAVGGKVDGVASIEAIDPIPVMESEVVIDVKTQMDVSVQFRTRRD